MDHFFEYMFSIIKMFGILFLLVCLMVLMGNYALLKNIASRITQEAEITGVITTNFVHTTYSNSPLSKLNGQFHIIQVEPALNQPADHLGDKIYIEIEKNIHITNTLYIPIRARSVAINQGYYGKGYRSN